MTHDERNAEQIEAFREFLREERAQTVLASSAPQRTTEFWLEWMQRPQPLTLGERDRSTPQEQAKRVLDARIKAYGLTLKEGDGLYEEHLAGLTSVYLNIERQKARVNPYLSQRLSIRELLAGCEGFDLSEAL